MSYRWWFFFFEFIITVTLKGFKLLLRTRQGVCGKRKKHVGAKVSEPWLGLISMQFHELNTNHST